jgi:uncharacterized membrane protein HdeD (DUF308 family)
MTDRSLVVRRFAKLMLGRGGLASVAGILALARAEAFLLVAMLLTGVVLVASGAYEVALAVRRRRENRGWPLALGDGAACVGMGLLTLTTTVVPLRTTVVVSALWLAACGTAALLLAFAVWPMRRTRLAMLSWAVVQVALSCVAFDREPGLVTLLYVGAGYAIAFGIFQVVASIWMLRVAVPRFEPTVQESWD